MRSRNGGCYIYHAFRTLVDTRIMFRYVDKFVNFNQRLFMCNSKQDINISIYCIIQIYGLAFVAFKSGKKIIRFLSLRDIKTIYVTYNIYCEDFVIFFIIFLLYLFLL